MAAGMSIVLDTTVLIDALRGDPSAFAWLGELAEQPSCSEVTRVEILRGLRSQERAVAERLFAGLAWVPVTESVARRAGEFGRQYRRSHATVGTNDLIVAATAVDQGLPVATSNLKHFPMFEDLARPY